ncbi:hypothetical protein HN789_06995 [archaeon]|jgi:hypothetical protein|nr:hypothetical protein [archaeon]MBT4022688.1 hypothetical protein [archaeon]MBT4273118.1 hypothetical protein [archaeon]MBT4461099.1 hypothetical protein [archaeon]MBT4858768.1 hypothetical protein [archaeon]
MKKITVLFIVLVFLISACSRNISQNIDGGSIQVEIDNANFCDTKDDCIDVESKCPFGCNIFVNKDQSSKIKDLIESYETNCMYKCRPSTGVDCIDNKCEATFDQEQDLTSCQTDDDCSIVYEHSCCSCPMPMNKAYVDEWNINQPTLMCDDVVCEPCGPSEPIGSKCVENKCQLVYS